MASPIVAVSASGDVILAVASERLEDPLLGLLVAVDSSLATRRQVARWVGLGVDSADAVWCWSSQHLDPNVLENLGNGRFEWSGGSVVIAGKPVACECKRAPGQASIRAARAVAAASMMACRNLRMEASLRAQVDRSAALEAGHKTLAGPKFREPQSLLNPSERPRAGKKLGIRFR